MIASGGNPDGPTPRCESLPRDCDDQAVHWDRTRDRGAAVRTTCSVVDLCTACDLLCVTSIHSCCHLRADGGAEFEPFVRAPPASAVAPRITPRTVIRAPWQQLALSSVNYLFIAPPPRPRPASQRPPARLRDVRGTPVSARLRTGPSPTPTALGGPNVIIHSEKTAESRDSLSTPEPGLRPSRVGRPPRRRRRSGSGPISEASQASAQLVRARHSRRPPPTLVHVDLQIDVDATWRL